MPKMFTSRRVRFPAGKQRAFLEKVSKKLSLKEIAHISGRTERTVRDWRQGKFLMTEAALKALCKRLKREVPRNISYRDAYWYVTKGARAGGIASYQNQGGVGDPEVRLKRWREWWETKGKFSKKNPVHISIPVKKPMFSSTLAEFCGIMLGDGGISRRQVTVTLHSIDDREYINFVLDLATKLFGVTPSLYPKRGSRAYALVMSRSALVDFLVRECGLVQGNKIRQQINIPEWIWKDRNWLLACVRGLVDTDGCIFTHRYKINGKEYAYKKLSFTTASEPLLHSVFEVFESIGCSPRIGRGRDVRLDSKIDMQRYFTIIGSSNPKHLERYYS